MKARVVCLILTAQLGCSSLALDGAGGPGQDPRFLGQDLSASPSSEDMSGATGDGSARAAAREHRELADRFVRSGMVNEAIDEYLQAIDLDPFDGAQYFRLGLAYQSQQRFEEAALSYEEAVRLEPTSIWAHAALSIVYAKAGNPEAALSVYRDVRALDRETARGLLAVILKYGSLDEV